MIAGVAAYVKYLRPDIKVIGVEAEDSACLKAALEAGERVVLDQVGVFAEGVAVAQIGEVPFSLIQGLIDEVITVNTDEMCAAVKDIFEDTRAVAETSGALSLAGLKNIFSRPALKARRCCALIRGQIPTLIACSISLSARSWANSVRPFWR
ncbi:hypothetical protein HSBAA_00470 [Vreelandella sulfidaeris]|uniref:Tryptophan synthase beta chain-like PALP domain-containing protein n=1 Tax=Vreelandella sulfidaeris TaxID=115553 RepID=A0A455U2N1_9GAMM|nr:hypothetical protein HSBAA_00470 [Halomonas sulfidaeris]